MCDNCAVHGADGAIVCRQCQRQVAVTSDAGTAPVPPPVTARPLTRGSTVLCCKNHPDVAAATRMRPMSSRHLRDVRFLVPRGHSSVPAVRQPTRSRRFRRVENRRRPGPSAWEGSAWAVAPVDRRKPDVHARQGHHPSAGCCFTVCFVLGIIGFVLGITSFNRRAHNPGYLWFGVILNALVILLFVSLTLLGLMRGAG